MKTIISPNYSYTNFRYVILSGGGANLCPDIGRRRAKSYNTKSYSAYINGIVY